MSNQTIDPIIRFHITDDSGKHIRNCVTLGEAKKHAKRILLSYPQHTVLQIRKASGELLSTIANIN